MSDTPRTDSENARFPMGGFTLDFCRGMERELTEARDALKFRRELYALQTGHLNNVRAQLSEEQRLHVKTLDERDRLAETALFLADVAEKNTDDGYLWRSAIYNVRNLADMTEKKYIETLNGAEPHSA